MMEPLSAVHDTISHAFEQKDLDAFVCALVLHSGFGRPESSAWADQVTSLLQLPLPALQRPHDVAVAGVRLALGDSGLSLTDYATAAKRELAREPLPPAACCRDDERLLIGVCAGIAKKAPELQPAVSALVSSRAAASSPRQRILDGWSEALSVGAAQFTADTAQRAMRYLRTVADYGRPLTLADQVAVLWLSARLLDAPWQPSDSDLGILDALMADARKAVLSLLSAGHRLTAIDSALVADALSTSPPARIARLGVLEGVLAAIDQFAASASVLGHRQRDRPAFTVEDEYDVQDLLHALLLPIVPDLVPEDPASKIAGKASRLDFTSRAARLGIETKHVRSASHGAKVRDEILVDEATYQAHPYVETVVAFVHDPEGSIASQDRAAFEADLSKTVSIQGRTVRYITRVR
jgi:hypothetical protein